MHEWIKLHRSILESEVYSDSNAKAVFIHFLLIANSQGKGKFSRYATSRELGMNPSTFQSGVERCKKKYQLCITRNTNKYTEFTILNWSKYQSLDISENINKTSTRHQRDINQTSLYKEKNKNKNILDKSKMVQAPEPQNSEPQENKKNVLVDHTLEEFKRVYGFYPTDKKPRYVAYNLIQRIKTVTADRFGGELTQDRLQRGITRFFNWLQDQEGFEGIQRLETAKLKLNIFMETLPRKEQNADTTN